MRETWHCICGAAADKPGNCWRCGLAMYLIREGYGGEVMARGRPYGQMTHLRRKALDEIADQIERGEPVMVSTIARRLHIHRQSAQRILRDLKALSLN